MTLDRPLPPRPDPLPSGEREKSTTFAAPAEPTLRQALLSPRAIALIGQSNDAEKTAGRPLKYLRQAGYAGRIFPINARRKAVLGERAWPSLTELPERPDHAYI